MIRAIIFDLDGTLADTEPLHFEAFARVLHAEGIELGRAEYFSRLIGFDDRDCFTTVLRENRRTAADGMLAALIERKAAIYQQMIAGRDVTFPGAADFVRRCFRRFPLIVATGTLRVEAESSSSAPACVSFSPISSRPKMSSTASPRPRVSRRRWDGWAS